MSNDEWFSDFPKDWRELRADFLCDPYRETVSPDRFAGNLVAHYSIPQVQETGGPLIEAADDIDSAKILIRRPTLLVSKLNPRKKTICIAEPQDVPTLASGEFVSIHSEQFDQKYAYYVWVSEKVTDRLSAIVQSATRSHQRVSPDDIVKLPWKWPSLKVQGRIAAYLDKKTSQIDALLKKKQALLERLREKRQAIITEAVTKGLDPTVPVKDSGVSWLGEIPAHWTVYLLKRKYDVSYGVGGEIDRSLETGTPLLSLPNISIDGRLLLDDVPFTDDRDASLLLEQGDLLFNWRNGSSDHLGKTVLFNLPGEWKHVSFLLRLRRKDSDVHSDYLRYFLSGLRETGFFAHAKAGVNNTFNLFELRHLAIASPPTLAEQEAIARYISDHVTKLDEILDIGERSIALLAERRSALITAAVTGKIDGMR